MEVLEKDIEDVVWYLINNDRSKLSEIGFPNVYRHPLRQVRLGEYGVADLISWDYISDVTEGVRTRAIYIQIIEFKRDVIGPAALMQSHRYETAIRGIIDSLSIAYDQLKFHHVLVGSGIDFSGDFPFLYNSSYSTTIVKYTLDIINGLQFVVADHGWVLNGGHGLSGDRIKEVKKTLKNQLRSYGKKIDRHQ